jgi:hypothetical protein
MNNPATAALQIPAILRDDYMMLSIDVGFDWAACFEGIDEGEWYLVAFRCKHRPDADEAFLTQLDMAATTAAQQTPGFLFYFAGVPCSTGECLSFCLWNQRSSAQAGAAHSAHRTAMISGIPFYEYYELERYQIQKRGEDLVLARV